MIHMRTAMYAGLLVASPYILYELFRFVSPGLYQNERRYAVWIVGAAYLMFLIGTLVNYLVVFPFTVRFLGTYQVSPDVANMLTLQSYVDTLLGMSPGHGCCLRTACRLRTDGEDGTHQRSSDGTIPSPRLGSDTHRVGNHHAND